MFRTCDKLDMRTARQNCHIWNHRLRACAENEADHGVRIHVPTGGHDADRVIDQHPYLRRCQMV